MFHALALQHMNTQLYVFHLTLKLKSKPSDYIKALTRFYKLQSGDYCVMFEE